MWILNFFEEYSKDDIFEKLKEDEAYLRKIGFLGYFIGTFTLFISLRVLNIAYGGLFSFIFFFTIIIFLNYIFSALTNLFLDMIGHRKSASNLFYYFGLVNFLWLLALPFSFISKLMSISSGFFYFVIILFLFLFKLKIIKRVYSIRYKLAFVSYLVPYILILFLLIGGSGYIIYWLLNIIV